MPLTELQIKHFKEQTEIAKGAWFAQYVQKDDTAKQQNPDTEKGICLALCIHFLGHSCTGRQDRFLMLLDTVSGEIRVALSSEIMRRETGIPAKIKKILLEKNPKYKGMSGEQIGEALARKLRRHYFRELYGISWDRTDIPPVPATNFEAFGVVMYKNLRTAAGLYLISFAGKGPYGHSIAVNVGSVSPVDVTVFDANVGAFHFGHESDWEKLYKWFGYFFFVAGYDPYYCPSIVRMERYVLGPKIRVVQPPKVLTPNQPAPRHIAAPRQEDFYNDLLDDDGL